MQIPCDHIKQHQAETDAEQKQSEGNTSGDDHITLGDLIALDSQQMLPLAADTFDAIDTIILEGSQVNRVALCDTRRRPLIALSFSSPLVGLWSPPGRRAPFVCIEPWYGRCDHYGYEGEFAARDCMNRLEPGATFVASYTIEVF